MTETTTELTELTDVEFLDAILNDLDESWMVGTMCTPDGKKCLVGAGAAALGFSYDDLFEKFDVLRNLSLYNDQTPEYRIWVAATNSSRLYEKYAAERLYRLLGLTPDDVYSEETLEMVYESGDDFDVVDVVTTFNDRFGNQSTEEIEGDMTSKEWRGAYAPLRARLVEALDRAREKETAGV